MPPGWEPRFADDGKVYFFDHNRKTTTWLDPRTIDSLKVFLPKRLEKGQTEAGKTYFIDRNTNTTTWEDPRHHRAGILTVGLPKGWEIRETERGIAYFVDHNTKTTTWEEPTPARPAPKLKKTRSQSQTTYRVEWKVVRHRTENQRRRVHSHRIYQWPHPHCVRSSDKGGRWYSAGLIYFL